MFQPHMAELCVRGHEFRPHTSVSSRRTRQRIRYSIRAGVLKQRRSGDSRIGFGRIVCLSSLQQRVDACHRGLLLCGGRGVHLTRAW